MNIISTNINCDDKRAVYKLTKSAGVSVKDCEQGEIIEFGCYAEYEDVKPDGHVEKVLSIVTPDGVKYSTVSATFKREFYEILDLMDGEDFSIVVCKGTTKAGRDYVSCELYCG